MCHQNALTTNTTAVCVCVPLCTFCLDSSLSRSLLLKNKRSVCRPHRGKTCLLSTVSSLTGERVNAVFSTDGEENPHNVARGGRQWADGLLIRFTVAYVVYRNLPLSARPPSLPFFFAFQGQGRAISAVLNTAWKNLSMWFPQRAIEFGNTSSVGIFLKSRQVSQRTGERFHCLLKGPHPLADLIQCKHMQPEPAHSVLLLDSANLAEGLRLLLPLCPSVF